MSSSTQSPTAAAAAAPREGKTLAGGITEKKDGGGGISNKFIKTPAPTLADIQRHRSAVFVVPHSAISQAIEGGAWSTVAAFCRINALACCKAAQHGWLGGSFSCCEIMIHLHCRCPEIEDSKHVVLSKGHAAAMQYSCLYAVGVMTSSQLLDYKAGAGCPEAHADLLMDTGSLGQCLSTTAGLAVARRDTRFAIVLGDGELQEGQVWEALMTVHKYKLTNLTIFIDANGFQSDNECAEIMPLADLPGALRAFGFSVVEIDGHDAVALDAAWKAAADTLTVILARTIKGGGSSLLPATPHAETGLLAQPWHTKVPQWDMYVRLVEEQLEKAGSVTGGVSSSSAAAAAAAAAASEAWSSHKAAAQLETPEARAQIINSLRPAYRADCVGTGKAFGAHLVSLLETRPDLALVDADLATSCGINGAVGHPSAYYEVGVAEQDAVSFAAGLALGGRLPIVCTYSNFLKRAYENIFIASVASGTRIIYAGHYSGLCYHTDGKSHQSTDDLSVFSALGSRLVVIDPVSPAQAVALADWAISPAAASYSVYFRLRRTPDPELAAIFDDAACGVYSLDLPVVLRQSAGEATPFVVFVTMGTVATSLALRCVKELPGFSGASLVTVPALNTPSVDEDLWRGLLAGVHSVVSIEDDRGALKAFLCERLAKMRTPPKLVSKTVDGVGPSFRTLDDCLAHHGFTPEAILEMYCKALDEETRLL